MNGTAVFLIVISCLMAGALFKAILKLKAIEKELSSNSIGTLCIDQTEPGNPTCWLQLKDEQMLSDAKSGQRVLLEVCTVTKDS